MQFLIASDDKVFYDKVLQISLKLNYTGFYFNSCVLFIFHLREVERITRFSNKNRILQCGEGTFFDCSFSILSPVYRPQMKTF